MIIQSFTDWVRGPKANKKTEPEEVVETKPDALDLALKELTLVETQYKSPFADMEKIKYNFIVESDRMKRMADEIRRSEIELYESRKRYENIFNTLGEAIFICDTRGFIVQTNEKFKSIFSLGNITPLSYYDLFPDSIDQWRYMQHNTMSSVIVSFETNPKINVNGLYLLSSAPLNDKEIVGVLTDLTDLGEAKALTIRRQKIIEAIESISGYVTTYSWEQIITKTVTKLQDVTGYDIACFINISERLRGEELIQLLKITHYSRAIDCDYDVDTLNISLSDEAIVNSIEQIRVATASRTRVPKAKCPIKSDLLSVVDRNTLHKLGIRRFVSHPIVVKGRRYGAICLIDAANANGMFDTIIEEDITQMMSVVACLLSTYIITTKTLVKLNAKEDFIEALFIDYQEYVYRFNKSKILTFCRQHNDAFLKYNGADAVGKTMGQCLKYEDDEYIKKLNDAVNELSVNNRKSMFEHQLVIPFGSYTITETHRQVVRAIYTSDDREFIEYQVTGMVLHEEMSGQPDYPGESEDV